MIPTLVRSQVVVRVVVLLGPLVALLATGPAGHWPPWWVVLAVGGLAAGFAAYPDSHAGTGVVLLVATWWAISLGEDLQPEILIAGAALLLAHVAGVLASYGPGELPLEGAVVRLWVRRGALVLLVVPATWGLALLVDGQPEQPGIWILGVFVAVLTIIAGTVALAGGRAGEGSA
jgi:hypothetical protein